MHLGIIAVESKWQTIK